MSLDTERARALLAKSAGEKRALYWGESIELLELVVSLSARVDGLCAVRKDAAFDAWANEGDWSYHWDSALGRGRRHDVTGELEWWEDRQ